MSLAILVAGAILGLSALLIVVRMTLGPTMLDRAIAFDVLAAVLLGAIALEVAADRDADAVAILLVLTLLGFVGSVSIARFFPGSEAVDEPRYAEDPASEEQAGEQQDGSERARAEQARAEQARAEQAGAEQAGAEQAGGEQAGAEEGRASGRGPL